MCVCMFCCCCFLFVLGELFFVVYGLFLFVVFVCLFYFGGKIGVGGSLFCLFCLFFGEGFMGCCFVLGFFVVFVFVCVCVGGGLFKKTNKKQQPPPPPPISKRLHLNYY